MKRPYTMNEFSFSFLPTNSIYTSLRVLSRGFISLSDNQVIRNSNPKAISQNYIRRTSYMYYISYIYLIYISLFGLSNGPCDHLCIEVGHTIICNMKKNQKKIFALVFNESSNMLFVACCFKQLLGCYKIWTSVQNKI